MNPPERDTCPSCNGTGIISGEGYCQCPAGILAQAVAERGLINSEDVFTTVNPHKPDEV